MGKKTGIILEGGAMRGIFTAGVMDLFLDKGVEIPNVLAISAGAYAGMNYISGQRGRIIESVIRTLDKEKICGFDVLLKTGDYFNMDLLFDRIQREGAAPFDFEAFKASDKRFITSTINCLTGEPQYFEDFKDFDEFIHITRVANSLPMLARTGWVDGVPMLDGGMYDAIPIAKALEEKWDKIIVVFTREASYRKKNNSDIYNSWPVKLIYHKYKGLLKSIEERPKRYNDSIELLNKMEQEGKVFVIRPEGVTLTNGESDPEVLERYYHVGYDCAAARYDELMAYLND